MKAAILALFLLSVPSLLIAGKPAERHDGDYLQFLDLPSDKQPKELGTLLSSEVPSRQAAEKLAFVAWGLQIRAYQTIRVVGLYRAAEVGGVGIAGFAAPGHWVWEVHIGPVGALSGIALVDAQTKAVHVFPSSPSP